MGFQAPARLLGPGAQKALLFSQCGEALLVVSAHPLVLLKPLAQISLPGPVKSTKDHLRKQTKIMHILEDVFMYPGAEFAGPLLTDELCEIAA